MTDSSDHEPTWTSRELGNRATGLQKELRDKFRQSLAKRTTNVYTSFPSPHMSLQDNPLSSGVPTSFEQLSTSEVELCPTCGSALDTQGLEPLSQVICPSCQTQIAVHSQLLHFRLTSILGHGGMGCVYKAYDDSLGRYVALKLLRADYVANADYLERLQREAGIMAQLSHPNVVRVFSIGSDHGKFFLAMELVEHGTLDDVLQRQGRMAEIQALDLGIQAARGLQAAHEAGVLHRDVKPGNILFVDGQTVKITDFGLAESADQTSSGSDEIIGTPYYIAPERLNRQREDCRSDIYSLGATLFHAIAGRPPFEAEDATAVALKRLKSQPVSLATYAPRVSGSTAFVINRTLHKDPAQRYQTYEELIEHLEYARNELLNATGKPQSRARVVLEDEEQQKLWAWISIGMIAVVILASGGFFLFRDKSTPVAASTTAAEALNRQSGVTPEFEEAADLLARSRFEEAANAFRSIASKNAKAQPLGSWALLYTGVSELFAGRLNEADDAFRQLESLRANSTFEKDPINPFFVKIAQTRGLTRDELVGFASQFDRKNHEALGLLALGLRSRLSGNIDATSTLLRDYRAAESTIERSDWKIELRGPVTTLLGQAVAFQNLANRTKTEKTPEQKLALLEELRGIQGAYADQAKNVIASIEKDMADFQASLATYPKPGVYRIINEKSGKAMEIRDGSRDDDARVVVGSQDPAKSHQEWLLWPAGMGVYRIEARHSKKMLDLLGNSADEGVGVGQWRRDDGLPQQRWRLQKGDKDSFTIVAADTGKVLSVKDGSTANGAEVLQFSDRNNPEQRWKFVPVIQPDPLPEGTYMFMNAESGFVLDVADRKKENGIKMVLWDNYHEDHQRFHISPQSDGSYRIEAVHSKKAFDVEAISTDNGARVHQWEWVGGDNQRWKITHSGGYRYQLSPKHAQDKVLSLTGSGPTERRNETIISSDTQASRAYWILIPSR